MAKQTAVILAGAVAKGAFEAGALEVVARRASEWNITRLVGASSGALNAAVFAVGVRAGREAEIAERLVNFWEQSGTWHNALELSWRDLLSGEGLGTADRLLGLMRDAVHGVDLSAKRAVNLQLVVTALRGTDGDIGGQRATTFERVLSFMNESFDDELARERVFQGALASGAFPVLFAPVDVPGVGPCADGGTVNNTPVKLAIDSGDIERVIVITPDPLLQPPSEALEGVKLVTQFAEILVRERLYRDLHQAEAVNASLRRLDALEGQGLSAAALAQVKTALGWRPLEIIQIRPDRPLPGGSFSALSDADLRVQYVNAGRAAAVRALAEHA